MLYGDSLERWVKGLTMVRGAQHQHSLDWEWGDYLIHILFLPVWTQF